MAYGYLLAPSFQFVNINGRPIANGHVEVFLTNTDTKYITKCDFNGTDNPFKVPLNSKGMAVIIASGDFAYDVFCYDRFGSLFWSGSNIRIEGATGVVIDGANLPLRIVGGKIDNNGKELTCTGENAWAEGAETTASGANAHAEGGQTTASGEHSHSEGFRTTSSSGYSHAEGAGSKATSTASHAEGQDTTASGQASHAEGRGSFASGDYSHASGRGTRATNEGSHAVGKWNDDGDALFVVGDGTNKNQRHDAFKVDRDGDTWVSINGVLTKVTNVSGGGGGDQFVLVRANMTTDFTNQEYQDCVDAITAEQAVCVQFVMTGSTIQAQLTMITGGGTLIFEFTADRYHYRWEVAATNNAHTVELTGKIFGVPIFDTLQDAISNEHTLESGDVFDTNGFHTSGDGGAARYRVSSTGTANGMDIIQLSAGKLAVLQVDREAFVEQIGYEPKSSAAAAADLTPYLQRLFAMNVYRIKFKATWLYYYMKTPLEINKHDAEFIGGLDTFSGYSSRIEYVPNNDVVEDYCFKLNARRIKFKHLYINDNPTRTHICFKTDNPSGNHEGYVFDGLNVSLFDIAFSLCGAVNWQHTFNRVRFNQCRIGLYTQNTFFMNNLTECYFSCLEKDVFSESEYNAVTFTNCNFECLNMCVHFSYWKQDPELANKLFTLTDCKFICCSFEFHLPEDVPSNVQGCFIYVDDFVQAKLNLDTQNLSLKKLADTNPAVTDTTCFSFGENTYCTFVSVRGQDYTSYWASKFLWDNTRHPAKDIGAITIVNSYNIPMPSFGDLYLPTFRGNDGVIHFSNSTNILVNYPSLKDGDKLFNLDDGCYYTKSADQLVKVSNSPNNFVRIGNELYNYVIIGSKKWITRSLRLQTTNSKILFKKETGLKEEWGFYYPFGDRAELSAKLPTGWRIPTKTDLDDLITSLPGGNGTEKAHNAQSTQYPSAFPNATNTSGLNIPPSQQYVGTSYVRGYFMSNTSKYTLVVNANGILEYDISPDYPNLISPIRVCADV